MTAWYERAIQTLDEAAVAVQGRHMVSIRSLEVLASDVVASLYKTDELVVEALSGPPGSPLLTNLLNVAILGTRVGIGLGYYGEDLHRLALAGLVHDIGLFSVPASLLNKRGRLTPEERTLIEQHPERGYEIILACDPAFQWLAQVTRQAHERWNGQGYPQGLKGRQIDEMAQICGLVDVFDALVSERPYRPRLFPHEAMKELLVAERATFPREILKALVEQLSVYPVGTTVRLTTGDVGVVVKINSRYPLRPVVRVNELDRGAGVQPRELDLSLTPLITVVETLKSPVAGQVQEEVSLSRPPLSTTATEVSDHFTALLESLDAIVSTLQEAVETEKRHS
ncbi:MAG: HD-GYP domain-containing protein [Nitrospira sp.]|nr:HD-GYP domain-containing protein [Nitrospira sp.]MBS0168286.1 HD-GYP domain-containing protein [Nitrospira sp.]